MLAGLLKYLAVVGLQHLIVFRCVTVLASGWGSSCEAVSASAGGADQKGTTCLGLEMC